MDWSDRGVPGVWEVADVKKIVATPRHIVIHRRDGCPLYLGRGVALAAYGEALKQDASALTRQRDAIVRDRRIDFAILALMGLLGAVLLVLSWVRW